MMRALLLFTALSAAACGLGPFDDEPGGASSLPTRGAGPYKLLAADPDTPVDEPYLVVESLVSLRDPAVRELEDGRFEIYYGRENREGVGEIWRQRFEALDERPSEAAELVLSPSEEWERGWIGEPALVEDGDGTLYLYYRGDLNEPGIGRAVSIDGGESFGREPSSGEPLRRGLIDPSLVFRDGRFYLVAAKPDASALLWFESDDGLEFGGEELLLEPRRNQALAFDRDRVRAPALHLSTGVDGQLHYGLFYTGAQVEDDGAESPAIGYLGSFDGIRWERALSGGPVLEDTLGVSGASPIIRRTQAFLFVHQLRAGRGRIAVATSP